MLVGRLAAPAPQPGEWTEADWISDLDLDTTLLKAYADKYHPHPLIGPIRRKVQILKLPMQGYSNMAIAATLDIDQEAVKSARRSIVEHLTRYCNQIGITPPELPAPKLGGWESRYYLPNHGCRVGPRQKRAA